MTSKTSLLLLLAIFALVGLPAAEPVAASSGTQATFIRTDTSAQGNWKGVYGSDGYVIADTNTNQVPGYVVFTPQSQANWIWTSNGTETRDLQVPGSGSTNARQASCWYTYSGNSFGLDVNITDGNTHQFALYALDWDNRGRAETIQAVDGVTGAVLDTRSVSNFNNGIFFIWTVSGHVKFNVIGVSGPNAVISGAFFDIATANSSAGIAHFVSTDTSTEGKWVGVYGADGYTVVGGTQSTPAYAALTPQNQQSWTWASSTADPRALQAGNGSGNVAATWYNWPAFSIDVNITDGNSHQIALYSVDWDNRGRAATIQVVDAQTKAVLDSRSIFNFTNGIYVLWNVSGHVQFIVTSTGGPNAVVSGVFFGAGGSVPAPSAVSITAPIAPPVTSLTTTTSSSASNSTLPSGLVLHWTFDTANISGTTVADTSNHGGNGTLYGNPSQVAGKLNQALGFNGVNSYVSMPAYSDVPTEFTNSITLAAWINTTNATRTEAIISKFSAAGSAAGYVFQTDSAGHLELRVGAQDLLAYPAVVVDTAKVNDGQWHHVAVVINMGQGVQFYVDGNLSSSPSMSVWAAGDNWSNLEVGACSYTPYAQYFTGSIDDIQVYNRALLASDIGAIFSSSGGVASQGGTSPAQTTTTPSPTVAAQGYLSLNPSIFSFGSVNIGNSASQPVVVSNTGSASVTLSNVSVSGAGLNATGLSSGSVLAPGKSATLSVTFTPAAAVGLAGGVTFTSNASNSSVSLMLTGTGVQPPPVVHSIMLTWGASSSPDVVGYDVYRGTVSGGPYTLLTPNPVSATSYTDASGQPGQTYYYVVTSVDSTGTQSSYSNVVSATIP